MPRRITHLVIHHAAGATGNAATIKRHHVGANGWSDIGYHAVITNGRGGPDGEIQAGRNEARDGAGVYGNNARKLHVCLIGQFAKGEPGYTPPTVAQLRSLGEWLVNHRRTYGNPQVVGHKEITVPGHGTLCPGDLPVVKIREWLSGGHFLPLDKFLGGAGASAEVERVDRTVLVETRPLKTTEFRIDDRGDTWVKASALRPELLVEWDGAADRVTIKRPGG